MRRGQDWRAAGLMLVGRGHLVAREEMFRLLLDYLFTPDTGISDPLDYADEQMAAAAGKPLFKRIARIAQRNIHAAMLTDPVTGCEIDAETAAVSVMARGVAGRPEHGIIQLPVLPPRTRRDRIPVPRDQARH